MLGTKPPTKANAERRTRLRKATALVMKTPSRTRQEGGADANINNILKRFGIAAPQRQGVYGQTIDYNMDLATARATVSEAIAPYMELPEALRARYRTLDEFRRAAESGAIKPADLKPPEPTPEPPKPPKQEVNA